MAGERVNVRHADGRLKSIPLTSLEEARTKGWRLETPGEETRRYKEEKYGGGVLNTLDAAAAGVNRMLTFGASDALLGGLNIDGERERLAAYRDVQPGATAIGEAAGMLPALAAGGTGALAKGAQATLPGAAAGLNARVTQAVAGEAPGVLRTIGAVAAGGAAEGALYGAGQGLSEVALAEDPLSAEKALSTIATGALLGGGVGGGAGAVGGSMEGLLGRSANATRARATRQLEALDEAAAAERRLAGENGDVVQLDRKAAREARVGERERLQQQKATDLAAARAEKDATIARVKEERVTAKAKLADDIEAYNREALGGWLPTSDAETTKVWLKGTGGLRRQMDAKKFIAKDPGQARKALQTQETALEKARAQKAILEGGGAGRAAEEAAAERAALRGLPTESELAARRAQVSGDLLKRLPEGVAAGERVRLDLYASERFSRWKYPTLKSKAQELTLNGDELVAFRDAIRRGEAGDTAYVLLKGEAAEAFARANKIKIKGSKFKEPQVTASVDDVEKFIRPKAGFFIPEGKSAVDIDRILAKNRALQARIDDVYRPVAELDEVTRAERLIDEVKERALTSPRLEALEQRLDELANAPKAGFAEQVAKTGLFGGTMSLATALGAPPMLGALMAGKASDALADASLGRLRAALVKGSIGAEKALAEGLDAFVGVSQQARRATAPVAASKVLEGVRFAPKGAVPAAAEREKSRDPKVNAYKQRERELLSQVASAPDGSLRLRPAARAGLNARLAGVRAVAPQLADQLEELAARRLEFLAEKLPKRPPVVMPLAGGPDRWQPAQMDIARFARFVDASENPAHVLARLADGTLTPEDAEAVRRVYPEMYAQIQRGILERLPELQRALPYKRRLTLSIFSGVPVDPAMRPEILAVLQGNFNEPGTNSGTQAPRPEPNFGAFGSVRKSSSATEPTTAQRLANP